MNNEGAQRESTFAPLTESARVERAAASEGRPLIETRCGTTPYNAYERIDELLALQHPRTNEPAEWTFYVIGQVMELLFKLLHHEVVRVRDDLAGNELSRAMWTLRRTERVQHVLESCWRPLEMVAPTEFNDFRDQLGSASGLQSYMFRQLEFALGNKSRALANLHAETVVARQGVEAALREPSVWDAAIMALAAAGYRINPRCLERDWSEEYRPDVSVERAWLDVYQGPARNPELMLLGESLAMLAQNHHRWRAIHVLVAERILGNKPGTGATAGVEWLRRAGAHRLFPELLSSRSLM